MHGYGSKVSPSTFNLLIQCQTLLLVQCQKMGWKIVAKLFAWEMSNLDCHGEINWANLLRMNITCIYIPILWILYFWSTHSSFLFFQWDNMRVLASAFLPGHRSMNPCPVYDEFTGTLFLFFIAVLGHTSESYQLVTGKNVTRLCYTCSTDDGATWSPVTDLTKKVIGDTIKGPGRSNFVKKKKKKSEELYCV